MEGIDEVDGESLSIAYGLDGFPTGVTLPGRGPIELSHDALRRVTAVTDPLGGVLTLSHDAFGSIAEVVDRFGARTSLVRDAEGRTTEVVDAEGASSRFDYDAEGSVVRVTDALGHETRFEYDVRHLLVAAENANGGRRVFVRDALGRVAEMIDEAGFRWAFAYDAVGRLTERVDPLGNRWSLGYCAEGAAPCCQVDPTGARSDWELDTLGRVARWSDADGVSTSIERDLAGRPVLMRDGRGHERSVEYDPLGRVVAFVDAVGNRTAVSHDAAGRPEEVVDARGHWTRFSYDGLGRRSSTETEGGRVITTLYDDATGSVTRDDGTGPVVDGHDTLGRLVDRAYADGSHADWTYDSLHRVVEDGSGDLRRSWEYDALGQVLAIRSTSSLVYALEYEYGPRGEVTAYSTTPGSDRVTYAWDGARRPVRIVDWDGDEYHLEYDAIGRLVRLAYPSGYVESRSYTDAGRLRAVALAGPSGEAIEAVTYEYDEAGNVVERRTIGDVEVFAYDAADRLVAASSATYGDTSYTYDEVGNLASASSGTGTTLFEHAEDAEIVAATGAAPASFVHDAAGRLVSWTTTAGTRAFDWTGDGRLARVTDPDGSVREFGYAADGLRVLRRVGGVETHTPLAGGSTVAELSGSGEILRRYLWLPGDDGRLLAFEDGAGKAFVLQDLIGSAIAVAGADGTVDRRAFSPYGGSAAASGLDDRMLPRFAGGELEAPGLQYHRNRWYATELGRWLSPDPLGFVEGTNRYAYAGGSPIGRADPWGLFSLGAGFFELQYPTCDSGDYAQRGPVAALTASMLGILLQAMRQRFVYGPPVGGPPLIERSDSPDALVPYPGGSRFGAPREFRWGVHVNLFAVTPVRVRCLCNAMDGDACGSTRETGSADDGEAGILAIVVGFNAVRDSSSCGPTGSTILHEWQHYALLTGYMSGHDDLVMIHGLFADYAFKLGEAAGLYSEVYTYGYDHFRIGPRSYDP